MKSKSLAFFISSKNTLVPGYLITTFEKNTPISALLDNDMINLTEKIPKPFLPRTEGSFKASAGGLWAVHH